MKLTIIAATGGIGRHVFDQALAAGHAVTAVARNPDALDARAERIRIDLASPDPGALAAAVRGAGAVLSGLGPRKLSEAGITSRGTRAVVEAMRASGTRRLLVVSAAPIGTVPSPARPHPPRHDPGDNLLVRYVFGPLIKAILRKPYADLAVMEDLLRDSGLTWTSARPPRLTNGPRRDAYRLAYGQNAPGMSISRADVAAAMLALIDDPRALGQTVGMAD